MKVVIDDKIPFIREAAERLFDSVLYLRGNNISAADVQDADALIVRTRTQCNKELLQGSSVKFIATATIGFDHIDTNYLKQAGIAWTNCPGCNAASVGQYVRNSLFVLQQEGILKEASSTTVGLVGLGHVGCAVAEALKPWGFHLLYNDPPKEEREQIELSTLESLAQSCDVITFHTPMERNGKYPTFHLANKAFFESLIRRPVIINAARGGVVDEQALLDAMSHNLVRASVIDTWEHEPNINAQLLTSAVIATPHIAGYSADGKSNATRMALEAVCNFFGITPNFTILPPKLPREMHPSGTAEQRELQLYNPLTDSTALKENPKQFEKLRGDYPLRREHWD